MIVSWPAGSDDTMRVALPFDNCPVPTVFPLNVNVTEPVGSRAYGALTAALNLRCFLVHIAEQHHVATAVATRDGDLFAIGRIGAAPDLARTKVGQLPIRAASQH